MTEAAESPSAFYTLDEVLGLEVRAREAPAAPALLAPGRDPLDYRALWERIGCLRQGFLRAGLAAGEAAALAIPSGIEFVTAFLAVAGISPCAPLDPSLTREDYVSLLSRLRASTLIADRDAGAPAFEAALSLGMRVQYLDGAAEPAAAAEPAFLPRRVDVPLLMFTSATTGRPKLAPLACSNLRAMFRNDIRALNLSARDRLLALMPLFHQHGIGVVLTQLSCGGSVVCAPGLDAGRFTRWLDEFRPTWLSAGSSIHRILATLARQEPERFRNSPLRFLRSTGAPPDPDLLPALESLLGIPVLEGYGTTETGGIARNTAVFQKRGSVGRSSGVEISITNESGRVLPMEAEGEILVRGPNVMSGYLDDEEANRAAFRNGWFCTGDLGHLDAEGFLFITGRLKEMINRGGKKIIPQEVDRALLSHPCVQDAAAFAVPHRTLGEDVCAAVVLRPDSDQSADERALLSHAAARLAAYKTPRRIVFVERIPRTGMGKIQRAVLSESYGRSRGLVPLDGELQIRLAKVWKRILHIEELGAEDDFFDLGGDSLSVVLMLSDAQKTLGFSSTVLDRADFFEEPTIAALARIIEQESAAPAITPGIRVLKLEEHGSRDPIFWFPASNRNAYYFRHLARSLGDDWPSFAVAPASFVENRRLLAIPDLARRAAEAIRSRRPQGPYVLAGHCFGGVLAYETALQLIGGGAQIARFLLFDAPAPGYPKLIGSKAGYFKRGIEMLRAASRGEARCSAADCREHLKRLSHLATRRWRARARRGLAAAGWSRLDEESRIKKLNGMALWEYELRDFPVPIAHFIAADQRVSAKLLEDPRWGWKNHARAGFSVHMVRGDHNSMLGADHSATLAAEVRAVLNS